MKIVYKFCLFYFILSVVIISSSVLATHVYEITDMGVNRGGNDFSSEQNKCLVDSIGQYVVGMNFGTGTSVSASLSSGYRFPVQIPIITNVAFNSISNSIDFVWKEDVDFVWLSEINQFLPDGSNFAANAQDLNLEKTACESFADSNHTPWSLRFYQVAFEDEFAEEIIGKITKNVQEGWNFVSVPFDPMTNKLDFLLDKQLNPGNKIFPPLADVVYAKANDSNLLLPHYYLNSPNGPIWDSLENDFLDLKRSFYILIQEESPITEVVFAGFVPKTSKNMGELNPGWTLVVQPYPVTVPLDQSDLWENGLTPGTITTEGHSGDAVYTQKEVEGNVLFNAFLQKNNSGGNPFWVGPMPPYFQPGKGYWVYIQTDHSGVSNWTYPLPYNITPIEF